MKEMKMRKDYMYLQKNRYIMKRRELPKHICSFMLPSKKLVSLFYL